MPVYEYSCRGCGHQFELLVRGKKRPACPSCKSKDLERLVSVLSIKTPSTRAQSLKAAKRRDTKQATDRMHDRLQYEQSHDRHG